MDVLLILIVICIILISLHYISSHRDRKIHVDSTKYDNNDEDLKDLIEKYKNIKDDNEWWKPCQECQYFEGYDICTRNGNFGAITDVSKARCEKHNLFVKK